MDMIREYAVSIIAAALLCSIVANLPNSGTVKSIVRMVCGMILTLTMIAPLRKVDLSLQYPVTSFFPDAAAEASAAGEDLSRKAIQKIIKEKSEAYILDKAAELHADITAEVILTTEELPVPEAAVISGSISPYAKQQLGKLLETQLGIAKERLEWTG